LEARIPGLELALVAGGDVAAQPVLETDDRLLQLRPGRDRLLRAERQLARVALAGDGEHEQGKRRAEEQRDETTHESHPGGDSLGKPTSHESKRGTSIAPDLG